MNKLLSIALIFVILLHSLGQSVVLIHYLFNRQYYATVLCENKAKPELHCNGKCQLMKELKANEKKEKSPASPIKEKQEMVQFFQENQTSSSGISDVTEKHIAFYLLPESQSFKFSILRPPIA
jgi:hypothetical protein